MLTLKLNNGIEIPAVGLGTWQSTSEDAYGAVIAALEAGYQHIDTAAMYGNEEAIGKAIADSKIPREELFVTTKVWNSDQGYDKTLKACELSLKKLGLEYIDLYLIHWFKGYKQQVATYKAMEEMYHQSKVRVIGVSNHNIHHIMNITEHCEVVPAVNQVETHISLQNHQLQEYCESKGILIEAYAPLKSWKINEMLANETMIKIAEKHNKSIPQVAVRWFIERGIIVIPKSVNANRIKANYDVFDFSLDKEDMSEIRKLNEGAKMFPEFDNVDF